MKLGLIGNPLGHSWSPEIHGLLIGEAYAKWPLLPEEVDDFFAKKDFTGINVTIPYKTTVMSYLDEIDPLAREIGAVNCIVNRDGKLVGYNTDCVGFMDMLKNHHIDPNGKNVAILGSGGASAACKQAIAAMGGNPWIISRSVKENCLTYEQLYDRQEEVSILVNATPVGMYPNCDAVPVDLNRFTKLEAVVDIIANPLSTRLCFEARCKGIPTAGGFEMLVRQAAVADDYFTGQKVAEETIQNCIASLLADRRNIVLIGMPTSGKSTIAKLLSEALHKEVIEMDEILVERLGMPIAQCFQERGEAYFRQMETELCKENRIGTGVILSCGGGVIKNPDNMRYLSENGLVIWIQRDLSFLYPTDSRPLSGSLDAIAQLYAERKDLYQMYSNMQIENNRSLEETVAAITQAIKGELL